MMMKMKPLWLRLCRSVCDTNNVGSPSQPQTLIVFVQELTIISMGCSLYRKEIRNRLLWTLTSQRRKFCLMRMDEGLLEG